MIKDFPLMPLSKLIQRKKDEIIILEFETYSRITIHLNGRGISVRDKVIGRDIGTKRQFVVKAGQLVLSKIDARNGAFGVVPATCDRAIITGNFWTYDVDQELLDVKFFDFLSKTPMFIDFCIRASDGTTNRRYLQEPKFLAQKILLPPLDEQRRIVARLEELTARIEEARGLRGEAREETEALVLVSLSKIFDYDTGDRLPDNWSWQYLGDLLINDKVGISTGPFGTLLGKSDILSKGIPVLGIANVQANRFVPGFNDYISVQKANSLSRYKLEADDIVIARSGTVGRSCVLPCVDPPPIMSTNLLRLRLKQDVFLPKLLSRLFNGSRLVERLKDAECRGSTRAFFTQHILQKLQLPVPPLSEQYGILAHLDHLESKVESLKNLQSGTSVELDALLPSILDKAFKGEL